MKKIKYIPEIDGLRAIAVIPVILYHLGFTWLPGGFLGVDVFFVISGYLITAILMKSRDESIKFYFYSFYLRRLRRIFPTFFFVTSFTLVASYFILLPEAYIELGRSALAGVSFCSNVYFYFNTGYFDAPAELMPLLHTWSLAVEEQFYLIWPALILFLKRFSKRDSILIVILIFSISLLLSINITPINPSLAFYNFPFRIFQFLLGAAIPLCISNKFTQTYLSNFISTFLQFLGLSLIIFSVLCFSNEEGFPGWLAIIPSFGATLCIFGASIPSKRTFKPMANIILVGIGKISFSLYLWHWPVITLYRIYKGGAQLDFFESVWLLASTFLLSLGSFQLIEKPFRNPLWQKKAVTFSFCSAFFVSFSFVLLIKTNGFSNRVPDTASFQSPQKMWEWDCPSLVKIGNQNKEFCNFGVPWQEATNKILLWGDSHAQQLTPLFDLVANEQHLSFLLFPSCRPVTDGKTILIHHPNPRRSTEGCYKSTEEAYDLIKNDTKISLVILAGAWQHSPERMYTRENTHPSYTDGVDLMKKGLKNTVTEVTKLGINVLLLGDTPSIGTHRIECAGANPLLRMSKPDCSQIPLNEVWVNQGITENSVSQIAEEVEHAEFHSIISSHCSILGCPIFSQGEFIYKDAGHIRRNMSNEIKTSLVQSFGLNDMIDWDFYKN